VSPWAADGFGTGGDAVPHHHICQAQFYMAEGGFPRVRLFALVGVDDLRAFTIRADAEVQGMLLEVVDRFYVDHVLTGKPPPLDGSDSCANYVAARYPRSQGAILPATPEAEEWAAEYRAASAQVVTATERRDKAKNHLKEFIGDADGVLFANGSRITWKSVNGKKKTDYQALIRAQQIPQDVVDSFTTRGAGYRAFRPSWKENNDGE